MPKKAAATNSRAALALAQAHHMAGRLAQAEVGYGAVLAAEPRNADALHLLGVIAHQQGHKTRPVELIAKAIAANPSVPAYHNSLGNALRARGRLDEAAAAYGAALSLRPDHVEAHNNLGNLLIEMGRPQEAVAALSAALAARPDFPQAHNNLGVALKALGRLDEAEAAYRAALVLRPAYGDAFYNLCELFEKTNRTEALRETVQAARAACPNDPRMALREAQLLKRDGDYGAARAVLEATADGARERTADAAFLRTRIQLLGDLCDRLDDRDGAFAYFVEANRLSRATPEAGRADGRRYRGRIDALRTRFTEEWVAGWRGAAIDDQRPDPVFMVGFPRSGTTLLDTILRCHPAITVIEEGPAVGAMRSTVEQMPGGYPDALAALDRDELSRLRGLYFEAVEKQGGAGGKDALLIDKLPLNAVEAGLIHRIFPGARFLFVQRHPCDCVLSCFMQNFDINDAMVHFLDLHDAADLYDRVMDLWRHYRALLPLDVHTAPYESLVVDFEETLTPLLEFLGLGWDDRLRDYAAAAAKRGMINTPSYNQVTQPLYRRASGRWERYEDHMAPVLPRLLPWAQRFGY